MVMEKKAAMRDMRACGMYAEDMGESLELDLNPKMGDLREQARSDENYSAEMMERMAEWDDTERLLALGLAGF